VINNNPYSDAIVKLKKPDGFADRICLIEDGCIVFDGPREEALLNEHVKDVFLGG